MRFQIFISLLLPLILLGSTETERDLPPCFDQERSALQFESKAAWQPGLLAWSACEPELWLQPESGSKQPAFELSSPQPDPVAVYLTWQRDPHTTITVHWITGTEIDTPVVSYRVNGQDEWLHERGYSLPVPYLSEFVNTVEITGLQPDQVYQFKVSPQEIRYFRTMPGQLYRPVRFIAGGDIYHREDWMENMNVLAASKDPEFILIGGDLAYDDAKPALAGRWLVMLKSFSRNFITSENLTIPIVVSIGNHEVEGGYNQSPAQAPGFYSLFAFPGLPGYNLLDFGDYMSLLVLDTQHTNPIRGPQTKWLAESLEDRPEVPHKFALYHVPAWPSFRPIDNTYIALVRENWVPLFEHYNLSFAFENHDHAFKRTHPIRNNRKDETGVVYLGDGAWGVSTRKLPDGETRWYLRANSDDRHFHLVTITPDRRTVKAYNEQGALIDRFSQRVKPAAAWPLASGPFNLSEALTATHTIKAGSIAPELTVTAHPDLAEETLLSVFETSTTSTPIAFCADAGITFQNTEGNPRHATGASIALDTRNAGMLRARWTTSIVESRGLEYAVRVQFRTGWTDTFTDLTVDGRPVEYVYSQHDDIATYDMLLPGEITNQPYVELRWKYYHTGTRERSRNRDGDVIRISNLTISSAGTPTSGTGPPQTVPRAIELHQNYPNPFNPVTVIRYSLPQQTRVNLQVFTSGGVKVATLVDEVVAAGHHTVSFDARGLSSGVYVYRLQAGDQVLSKRMTFVK